MRENENTALVRRWFEEVWNQRRLATINELLAPDAIAHDLGGPGASTKGRAEFHAAAEQVHRMIGEMHLVIEDIFGVDDRVAVRLTASFKNRGGLQNAPAAGDSVHVPVVCIVHLRNGQIIEGWNFWDVATALLAVNAPLEQRTIF